MKVKKFPLDKIKKYRAYLQDEQAVRFRNASKIEQAVENTLKEHSDELDRKIGSRDDLISHERLDMHRIRVLQEQILFAELDKDHLEKELIRASNHRERERKNWLRRKGESDAMTKLLERFDETVRKESIVDEQKEVDEIARIGFLRKEKN